MAQATTTEKPFAVGEFADFYEGEYRSKVEVIAVDGDEVTALVAGELVIFTPRPSDGMLVKLGSPDHEVMPTMIYRRAVTAEEKQGFFNRVKSFFA